MKLSTTLELKSGGGRQTPKKIVVHAMGEFIKADGVIWPALDWLRFNGLSAHALITPSGALVECRNPMLVAWHAKGHNTDSLGVEFLVPGIHDWDSFKLAIQRDWVSDEQYSRGRDLIHKWCIQFGIGKEYVTTHHKLDPRRRPDPGSGFHMEYIK